MKQRKLLSFLLVLVIVCSFLWLPVSAAETDLQLQCGNAVLLSRETADVLYDHNAYDSAYPASMTKVMTALLTLEALDAGTVTESTLVTVSDYAAQKDFADESTANLQSGEQMSVLDLLYCLMLPSANDAAKALAEHLGGTAEAFAQMMNRRAEELGCRNTHFVNPNGLHDPDHYTCAYDIALMFREAMNYDLFNTIIATAEYTTAPTNLCAERYFFNTNGLISNYYYSGHVYDKCIGGKTGFTFQAGRCLVAAAKDGDTVLISVVMGAGPITGADGSERLGQFDESTRLLEYGFLNFHSVTLSLPEEPFTQIPVTMSEDGDTLDLIPRGSVTRVLHNDIHQSDMQTRITLTEDAVQAPVEEGQVLGHVTFSYDGQDYAQLELVAQRSMEYSQKLERQQARQLFMQTTGKKILLGFALLLLLPVLILVSVRFVNIRCRKRRRKKRAAKGGRYAKSGKKR